MGMVRRCVSVAGVVLLLGACVEPEPEPEPPEPCDERLWYDDQDQDGFGALPSVLACEPGDGQVDVAGDCDDDAPARFPGAAEVCDGLDGDCDGTVDEGFDEDEDGWTSCAGDCDDEDPARNPGEVDAPCDGFDADCDGIDPCSPPLSPEQVDALQWAVGLRTFGCGSVSWSEVPLIAAILTEEQVEACPDVPSEHWMDWWSPCPEPGDCGNWPECSCEGDAAVLFGGECASPFGASDSVELVTGWKAWEYWEWIDEPYEAWNAGGHRDGLILHATSASTDGAVSWLEGALFFVRKGSWDSWDGGGQWAYWEVDLDAVITGEPIDFLAPGSWQVSFEGGGNSYNADNDACFGRSQTGTFDWTSTDAHWGATVDVQWDSYWDGCNQEPEASYTVHSYDPAGVLEWEVELEYDRIPCDGCGVVRIDGLEAEYELCGLFE